MKKILLTLSLVGASALTMYAQGRVNFNNYLSPLGNQPVTVGAQNQGPSGGNNGAFIGANYSVQLLWAPGTFLTQAAFDAATPSISPVFAFFGATGGSPGVDGAGLFDGGSILMGAPGGAYTMQARVWYNNTTFATYAAALGAGQNTGLSALLSVAVTESPTPAPNTAFQSFSVGVVPEPGTLALAGLGAASLLLFRRKK